MRTKSKLLIGMLLLTFSISLWAFNYRPDTWSTCLDDTAEFLDETEAPVTGYCTIDGTGFIENSEVDITRCKPEGGLWDEPNCTGNGALSADIMD